MSKKDKKKEEKEENTSSEKSSGAKEEKKVVEEEAEALAEESTTAIPEEEDLEEEGISLPFPRATIVNMLRQHLDQGKQIKGQVKVEMNLWLGKIVERIAKKMNEHPYTYVDGSMFWEAIESYESLAEIEKEKERLIKEMEVIKAACDVLINEVDRKFVLRKSFAHKYGSEEERKKK
ncbi:hypothetical protein KJ660_02550 [Candidatus Micrarchaeota archaeon]|nr:hypothetical protein [Candidatus Micrarchaeota archaeon]